MLDARVGSLTGSRITKRDKVLRELTNTANDQFNILPLNATRNQFGMHRLPGVPGFQVLDVLFKVPLDALCPGLKSKKHVKL